PQPSAHSSSVPLCPLSAVRSPPAAASTGTCQECCQPVPPALAPAAESTQHEPDCRSRRLSGSPARGDASAAAPLGVSAGEDWPIGEVKEAETWQSGPCSSSSWGSASPTSTVRSSPNWSG